LGHPVFGIFIVMQGSCFKQILVSQVIGWLGET